MSRSMRATALKQPPALNAPQVVSSEHCVFFNSTFVALLSSRGEGSVCVCVSLSLSLSHLACSVFSFIHMRILFVLVLVWPSGSAELMIFVYFSIASEL